MLRIILVITFLSAAPFLLSCTTDYYDDDPVEYVDVADYDSDDVYYDDGDWIAMFEDLDYYGLWYRVDPFGWVWRPTVVLEWQPYYHGEWIWTVAGWTWVSYEPFGWAVYHYGYWVRDFALGWVWVPDYEWVPCNVYWVLDAGYVYWAPMGPPEYVIAEPWDDPELTTWVGIKESHFDKPQVGRYKIKRNTFVSNPYRRTVRREPPGVDLVRRSTGRNVTRQNVQLAREEVNGYEVVSLVLPQPVLHRVEEYRVQHGEFGANAIAPPAGGQLLRDPRSRAPKGPPRKITPTTKPRRPREVKERRKPERREDRRTPETRDGKKKPEDKPAVQPEKKPRKKKGRPAKQRPNPPKRKPKAPEKKDPEKDPEKKDPPKKKKREPEKKGRRG